VAVGRLADGLIQWWHVDRTEEEAHESVRDRRAVDPGSDGPVA